MAFRPFEFFRKRQKLFMAGLVVMAMFLFVVGDAIVGRGGSGGGRSSSGLFSKVRRLFVDLPDRVATVGGTQYTIDQLIELRSNRMQAFNAIGAIKNAGDLAVYKEAGFTEDELKGRYRDASPIDQAKFRKRQEEILKDKPTALRDLNEPRDSLSWSVLQQFEQGRYTAYFDDAPSQFALSPLGLVDYVYWRKRADDLNIVMNQDQVTQDLVRMAGGVERVKPEDLPGVIKKHNLGRDLDTLVKHIGDEIRVMMAKGTVVGPERGGNPLARFQGFNAGDSGPLSVQVTPLDLWEAYVDVKRQLEVGILDIPVNQKEFLDKVPEPTPEQLKAFFDKYSKTEPAPTSEEPGFKYPKLYQIAFVYGDLRYGTDTAKYYRRWAQTAQALDPLTFLAEVAKFYEDNKRKRYRTVEDPFLLEQAAGAYVAGLAALSAQSAVAATPGLSVLRPAENLLGEPGLRRPDVAHLTLGMAGNAATGWSTLGAVGVMPRREYVEKFIPLDQLYDGIAEELTEERMRSLLDKDLTQLKTDLANYAKIYQAELAKWRNRPGARTDKLATFAPPPFTFKEDGVEKKEDLAAYLKRFAQTRGLVYEVMATARPKDEVFKEEAKTPLGTLLKPMFFHRSFMDDQRLNSNALQALTDPKGLFNAQREVSPLTMPLKPWEYALHWKVQETDPRVPAFEEVRAKVLEAWKVKEARSLVETHANELAKQVAATRPDGYRILLDRDGYHQEKTLAKFELQPVGLASMSYRPATLPVIEHPTTDVVTRAIAELKEVGDTMVVTNLPKSHYYVLVLRNRKEPRADDTVAIGRFDQEVILPDARRGLQINSQPLSDYVLDQKKRRYNQEWDKYLRQITHFSDANAEHLKNARDD